MVKIERKAVMKEKTVGLMNLKVNKLSLVDCSRTLSVWLERCP